MASVTTTSSRSRRIGVWILVVLATLITFGSAAEVWVKHQLLDTPAWVRASDKLLADPAVKAALSDYIVDQVYSNVDVQQQLADKLPADWEGLAGPLTAAVRGPLTGTVEKLLGTPKIRAIWHTVNTRAHETLVNVLKDDTKYGSTANGKVVLDLGEVIRAVAKNLGLPQSAVDRIPADAGQITLIQSDQLSVAQRAVKTLGILNWVLLIVVVGLYALAVFLARGRRRVTLRTVGLSLIIVAFGLVVVRVVSGNLIVDLIHDPNLTPAGRAIYLIGSELLVSVATTIATYGVVIVFGTFIVGPSRAATAVRRFAAPVMNADTAVFWIVAAVLFVIIWMWEPTPAFGIWWSVLALLVVAGLGLELLRRRSLAEFPDQSLEVGVDGIKQSAAGAWHSLAAKVRGQGGSSNGGDPVERLAALQSLHASGALTDEEFAKAKATVLDPS
jgi:Short C-terminal domain